MNKDFAPLSDFLGEIIDYRGKTPKKLGADWSESGYRVLSANNVTTAGIKDADTIRFVDHSTYLKWMKQEIRKGDLLLTSEAPAGQVMLWNSDEKIVLGQRLFGLRPKVQTDGRFLKYYIQSALGQKIIDWRTSGSTVSGISVKMFDHIPVVARFKESDRAKIGGVLGLFDTKIELNNHINAELEAMAKLVYDYWFVQFDFPMTAAQAASLGRTALKGKPYKSSGGKMVYNATLKRQIPEGWTASTVKSCSKLNELVWTDKTAPKSLRYVDLANTKNGSIFEVTDYSWSDAPSRARRKLRAGDTIIGTVRPGNRSYCLVPQTDIPLTGSTGFAVLTPIKDCYREFNYLSLTSATNIKRLSTLASGAAYPAVNPEVVASYQMPCPPESLIDRFHAAVKHSFDLMQVNQKQNQELTHLRDWLLPMLMNGQVTVVG